jgi:hypothetical protein
LRERQALVDEEALVGHVTDRSLELVACTLKSVFEAAELGAVGNEDQPADPGHAVFVVGDHPTAVAPLEHPRRALPSVQAMGRFAFVH